MKKLHGYKIGIISEDLIGFGCIHKKGSVVNYKRRRTLPDANGFRLTDYEWWYTDENGKNLIRTRRRIIEGLPLIKEPYKK